MSLQIGLIVDCICVNFTFDLDIFLDCGEVYEERQSCLGSDCNDESRRTCRVSLFAQSHESRFAECWSIVFPNIGKSVVLRIPS